MLRRLLFAVFCLSIAAPAAAQPALEKGLAGALHGCEEWVLNPASHITGFEKFIANVGLGNMMGEVATVDDAALPPKPLRVANHYWRINSTPGAGYILVVSDQLPMCHITGGGNVDLQPMVETVLGSGEFRERWEKITENGWAADMASTTFRNHKARNFSIVISRAKAPGQRLDRVQVLATAILDISR